ncbi:N-acetylglucosamine-6-phosphate deacetylase [Lysinibacter sp. HNR]|uniref:N-acetylglucosamine-6-phosphate deacetylase n=1 Tax=Lysinibacter sp. HNR TaxID=3031408 RepID=UPI002434B153|nr:N-acetylglucosamine-6-phosphate deacetylase [Lysinibacter sp. HNR]WGD38027.1 N-acetylglucosamine-6-phosphate deacetylase [Lysinibacter sp. HNR]
MPAPHPQTLIHSAHKIAPTHTMSNAWVLSRNGRVESTGVGDSWRSLENIGSHTEIIDAQGAYLTPGFIDIHVHGGAGQSFDEGPAGFDTILNLHRSHGTTRSIISLVTASLDQLVARTAAAAQKTEDDPRVLGIHLEGPFLNPTHKGAHEENLLHAATPDELDALLAAGRGHIRQVTLAPELRNGLDSVRHLVNSGVAVAIGHSNASYEQTIEAFAAGASILTHAFNGMQGIHHRAPGPVVAALNTPGVTLEVIADNIHVRPEIISMLFSQAPGRVALITDAMAAAGVGDGHYELGDLSVTVTDGVARLDDGGSIAGSTITLDAALRVAVHLAGVPLHDAVTALTHTPAKAVGYGEKFGLLEPGYAADLLLLSENLEVQRVWVGGHPVS